MMSSAIFINGAVPTLAVEAIRQKHIYSQRLLEPVRVFNQFAILVSSHYWTASRKQVMERSNQNVLMNERPRFGHHWRDYFFFY